MTACCSRGLTQRPEIAEPPLPAIHKHAYNRTDSHTWSCRNANCTEPRTHRGAPVRSQELRWSFQRAKIQDALERERAQQETAGGDSGEGATRTAASERMSSVACMLMRLLRRRSTSTALSSMTATGAPVMGGPYWPDARSPSGG